MTPPLSCVRVEHLTKEECASHIINKLFNLLLWLCDNQILTCSIYLCGVLDHFIQKHSCVRSNS